MSWEKGTGEWEAMSGYNVGSVVELVGRGHGTKVKSSWDDIKFKKIYCEILCKLFILEIKVTVCRCGNMK